MDKINLDLDAKQSNLLEEDYIVVDKNDRAIGAKSKRECHLMSNISNGLIHRAISVLLFNSSGEFLLTQRSEAKITFPNYFTNACCCHPLNNEFESEERDDMGVKRAALRRLHEELGIDIKSISINDFTLTKKLIYRAPYNDIWGEYEFTYILVIQKDITIYPNQNEVKFHKYLSREELKSFLELKISSCNKVTPWFKLYMDKFLFKIWDNLHDLDKIQDLDVVEYILDETNGTEMEIEMDEKSCH